MLAILHLRLDCTVLPSLTERLGLDSSKSTQKYRLAEAMPDTNRTQAHPYPRLHRGGSESSPTRVTLSE